MKRNSTRNAPYGPHIFILLEDDYGRLTRLSGFLLKVEGNFQKRRTHLDSSSGCPKRADNKCESVSLHVSLMDLPLMDSTSAERETPRWWTLLGPARFGLGASVSSHPAGSNKARCFASESSDLQEDHSITCPGCCGYCCCCC